MDADTGAVLSTLSISPSFPFTFGLGYDTARDVFIVTDAINDEILKVDPASGAVADSFPSPGPGPVGAAYDSTRDGYWISDFNRNAVDLVDPGTGAVVTTCSVSGLGASRIAGTGYSATGDVILFNSRDDANTYMIRASDCSSVGVFPTPPSPGLNNGQGAAIRPADLTGYLSNFEVRNIFVVELGLIQLVEIDIKPGGGPNPIKLSNKGVIPVAVLASDSFDVTDVDVTTLEFGPSGGNPAHDLTNPTVYADHLQDVNGDGFTDLVSHYRTQGTGISGGDTEACLTGQITGGVSIRGCDSVRVKSK
jgi:hypothetical protein